MNKEWRVIETIHARDGTFVAFFVEIILQSSLTANRETVPHISISNKHEKDPHHRDIVPVPDESRLGRAGERTAKRQHLTLKGKSLKICPTRIEMILEMSPLTQDINWMKSYP